MDSNRTDKPNLSHIGTIGSFLNQAFNPFNPGFFNRGVPGLINSSIRETQTRPLGTFEDAIAANQRHEYGTGLLLAALGSLDFVPGGKPATTGAKKVAGEAVEQLRIPFSTNPAENLASATQTTNLRQVASGQLSKQEAANLYGGAVSHLPPKINEFFDAAEAGENLDDLVTKAQAEFSASGFEGEALREATENFREMAQVFSTMGTARSSAQIGAELGPVMGPQTYREFIETASMDQRQNVARLMRADALGFDRGNTLYHITRATDSRPVVREGFQVFDPTGNKVLNVVDTKEEAERLVLETYRKTGEVLPFGPLREPIPFGEPKGVGIQQIEDRAGRGFVYFGSSPEASAKAAQTAGTELFDPNTVNQILGTVANRQQSIDAALRQAQGINIIPVWTSARVLGRDEPPRWFTELRKKAKENFSKLKLIKGWFDIPSDVKAKLSESGVGVLHDLIVNDHIGWQYAEKNAAAIEEVLDAMNFHGLLTKDESGFSTAILPKHSNRIRSIFAKFNPFDSFSPELSAAFAGATAVGAAAAANREQN